MGSDTPTILARGILVLQLFKSKHPHQVTSKMLAEHLGTNFRMAQRALADLELIGIIRGATQAKYQAPINWHITEAGCELLGVQP